MSDKTKRQLIEEFYTAARFAYLTDFYSASLYEYLREKGCDDSDIDDLVELIVKPKEFVTVKEIEEIVDKILKEKRSST